MAEVRTEPARQLRRRSEGPRKYGGEREVLSGTLEKQHEPRCQVEDANEERGRDGMVYQMDLIKSSFRAKVAHAHTLLR